MADTFSAPGKPPTAAAPGERRVLTALFCDVVNSTTLAEQMDPEDWSEIIDGAFRVLATPVQRYQGSINKLMGDAMLAFFGAPVAHEDDPQRAVKAGLDIIAAIRPYAELVKSRYGIDFNVRVGINTGPVVVAEVGAAGASDRTALGDAVNVAARMEQTASPGTVQISGATYRLVAPLFDVEDLGPIELKGKSEPVEAFRVIGPKAEPGRLRGIGGVSAPLVGRDRELGQLREIFAQAKLGRGHIVCLVGEAGLGKSRLLADLKAEWEADPANGDWSTMTGIPYDATRPFGLFTNFAREMFQVDPEDAAEVVHVKIQDALRRKGATDAEVQLCSVAFERLIAAKVLRDAPDYPEELIRKDIYENFYPGLREHVGNAPMVLVADDLHWADKPSVELLIELLPMALEAPIIFVAAFRPERQSPAWQVKLRADTDYPHRYTEIVLRPLDAGDTDRLVSELLMIADLPPELRQLILRKADGNPYFVEEIVRTLIDDGIVIRTDDGLHWKASTKVEDIHIPDNLQALLMARIDRLDAETRSTLQMAAVIGRQFYYRILQQISDSAMAIDRHLGSLERVELVRELGRMPELEYAFRHELARDAAYNTILNRRRREFHLRVAEAIEKLFEDRLEEQAHRLAQHYALAGEHAKALHYYEMAGDNAAGVHAEQAAVQFERALASARELAGADAIARLEAKRAALPAGAGL